MKSIIDKNDELITKNIEIYTDKQRDILNDVPKVDELVYL